jgi:hypothetical protein
VVGGVASPIWGSRGEAYAANAWQSFPLTNPVANCRRYAPRGMWFTNLEMTAALCFVATSMAFVCGLVVSGTGRERARSSSSIEAGSKGS